LECLYRCFPLAPTKLINQGSLSQIWGQQAWHCPPYIYEQRDTPNMKSPTPDLNTPTNITTTQTWNNLLLMSSTNSYKETTPGNHSITNNNQAHQPNPRN
jgi:hypothetical protein